MKIAGFTLPVIAAGFACSSAFGSISFEVVDQSLVPGFYANAIIWDGHGTEDWTSAALRIDLTHGSVYQTPGAGADGPPTSFVIGLVPEVEYDTYVGIVDGVGNGIAGGAGDLGGGPLSMDGPQISVSWFNNVANDYGRVRIGMITLSADAQGQCVILSGGKTYYVPVTDGMIWPEPTSLGLLGVGGLALLRRR